MLKTLKVIINASRPVFWFPSALFFLVGFVYGKGIFDWKVGLQLFGFTFPGCLMAFGLNDIFDYSSDVHNPRKKTSFNKVLEPEYHFLIAILALINSIFLILTSLLIQNSENLFLMVWLLFLCFAYSVPPLRFKTRPFLEIFTDVFSMLLVLIIGYSHTNSVSRLFSSLDPKVWLIMILWLIATIIFAFLADFEADQKAGDKNIIILLGKKTSLILLNLLYLSCLILSFDRIIIFVGIFILFLMSISLWKFKSVQIWQKLYHLHLFICILIVLAYLLFKLL
jgi:4-hydroxybenzoate polyprenyltransferase